MSGGVGTGCGGCLAWASRSFLVFAGIASISRWSSRRATSATRTSRSMSGGVGSGCDRLGRLSGVGEPLVSRLRRDRVDQPVVLAAGDLGDEDLALDVRRCR